MADTEDYHTGRAAAYHSVQSMLRRLLQNYADCSQIPREEIEKLQKQAEEAQYMAESEADTASQETGVSLKSRGEADGL